MVKAALKLLTRKQKRTQQRAEKAEAELAALKLELASQNFVVEPKRKRRLRGKQGATRARHVWSVVGGIRIALARNQGHAGVGAVLQHLGFDPDEHTHTTSINKWECRLSSAVHTMARNWLKHRTDAMDTFRLWLRDGKCKLIEPLNTWQILSLRGDATNTPANQSSKAHTREVRSAFGPGGFWDHVQEEILTSQLAEDDIDEVDFATLLSRRNGTSRILKVYPDIGRIPEVFGGKELREMFLSQLRLSGAPTWIDCEAWMYEVEEHIWQHFKVFFFASDQGPDQIGAHAEINEELHSSDLVHLLYFRKWCLKHVQHLVVKRQLKTIQSFDPQVSDWSTLANIGNCWRSSGKWKAMHDTYAALCGEQAPEIVRRRLPPRAFERAMGLQSCHRGIHAVTRAAERSCSRLRYSLQHHYQF